MSDTETEQDPKGAGGGSKSTGNENIQLSEVMKGLHELMKNFGELNNKVTGLSDTVSRLAQSEGDRPIIRPNFTDSRVVNDTSNSTNSESNTTVPVFRAFEQPKLHCILPKVAFSGSTECDGITLIHFIKIFEEECRIRKISKTIKPNLFIMQCIEPARSLIRSAAKHWDSWTLFRDELIAMFCTEADKAHAAKSLANIELKSNEKYWTFMDRIRSLSYQVFSHEIAFDSEGCLVVMEHAELNNRITDKFIQCITDRTLKGVILSELNRDPRLRRDPDYIARFADQTAQYLKPESKPIEDRRNSRYSRVAAIEHDRNPRRQRRFYEDVEPQDRDDVDNRYRHRHADRQDKFENRYDNRRENYQNRHFSKDKNFDRNKDRNSGQVNKISESSDKSEEKRLQCFGCSGYGHYKNECPTVLKLNKNREVKTANVVKVDPEIKVDGIWDDLAKIQTDPIVVPVSSVRPCKGIFIQTTVNNVKVPGLSDTGADVTILSKNWVERNLSNVDVKSVNLKLSVASSQNLPIAGCFQADIVIAGRTFKHTVLIAESLNCEFIIGSDFMRKFGCLVDLSRNVFVIGDLETPLITLNGSRLKPYLEQVPKNSVVTVKNVNLMPYSKRIIPVKVVWDSKKPDIDNRQLCLKTDYSEQLGVVFSDSFIKPHHSILNVVVSNVTGQTVNIKRGVLIGELEEVDMFYHDVDINTVLSVNRVMCEKSAVVDIVSEVKKIPSDLRENKLVDFDSLNVSDKTRREFEQVCESYHNIFSRNQWDLGECSVVPHTIELKPDAKPVQSLPHRVPYHLKEGLREQLDNMLNSGVIEKSKSVWSSPLVIVKKKESQGLRICVDLRKVNKQVYNETFPIVNIEDILSQFNGMNFYSTIDLRSGFLQQTLDEASKPITAFVCSEGTFQFCRTPFGLNRSPGSFCRMMQAVLGDLIGKVCYVYIDDIIVFSADEKSHVENIKKVLSRLSDYNLHVNPGKCKWFENQICFVGYKVSNKGIEMDPDRIEIIKNWPCPQNVKDIRKFLGMLQYYRKFVKQFSELSAPLTELTKANVAWDWTDKRNSCFESLKNMLVKPPVLHHPDFNHPFVLTTDASGYAIGGVLSQIIDNDDKPIAFGSRQLNGAEKNYCAHRQEALAMIYFVEKYKHFLLGRKFTLRTDCRALTYLMCTESKQSAVLARYVEILANYSFDIVHRPGTSNRVADALSRYPGYEKCMDCSNDVKVNVLKLNLQDSSWLASVSKEEMELAQRSDQILKHVYQWCENGNKCDIKEVPSGDDILKSYWNIFNKIKLEYRLLWYSDSSENQYRLIVPSKFKYNILELVHDHVLAGHRGVQNTLNRLRLKFFWIGMKSDSVNWVKSCEACVACKRSIQIPPLQDPWRPSAPDEKLCIDCIGPLSRSKHGFQYALCVMDDFSKFAQAFPLRSLTAKETANVLVRDYFCKQSVIPKVILSDRGSNFTSVLFKEMCNVLQIKGVKTLPYSPSSNGAIERWNNTLKSMLKVYTRENFQWVEMLPFLSLVHNSTVHSSTGFTPNFIHRGREARLPEEMMYPNIKENKDYCVNDYARNIEKKLLKAVKFVRNNLEIAHERTKVNHDKHVQFEQFDIGDKVLVKDCVEKTWNESGEIIDTVKNNPVIYKVKKENGQITLLHHNKLKKICVRNLIPCVKLSKTVKGDRNKKNSDKHKDYHRNCDESSSDEESSEELLGFGEINNDNANYNSENVETENIGDLSENVDIDYQSDTIPVGQRTEIVDANTNVEVVKPDIRRSRRNRVQRNFSDYEVYGDAYKCEQYKH